MWDSQVPPEFQHREWFRRLRALQLTLVCGSRDSYLSKGHLDEQRSHLEHHGVSPREMAFEGGHRLDRETLIEIATGQKPATG